MYHLYIIPIIFVAAMVRIVSVKYKLKICDFIAKIVIVICVVLFIYFYLAYKGFDLIVFLKKLV